MRLVSDYIDAKYQHIQNWSMQ